MTDLANISGVGLAGVVVVLGYYLINKMGHLVTKHLERQELLLQKILIQQMACTKELEAIKEFLRIFNDSR